MCCMKEKHLLRYCTLTNGMAGLLVGLRHVLIEKGDGKIKMISAQHSSNNGEN